jgi:hypothetical protein
MKKSSAYFEISDGGDMVRVEILGTTNSPSIDSQGKQWLDAKINVKGCTFRGQYGAEFMPIDFYKFRQQLVSIIYNLDKTAIFNGTEGFLEIKVAVNPADYFDIKIKACDVPGIGAELNFGLCMEKSGIDFLIQHLDKILDLYPISD